MASVPRTRTTNSSVLLCSTMPCSASPAMGSPSLTRPYRPRAVGAIGTAEAPALLAMLHRRGRSRCLGDIQRPCRARCAPRQCGATGRAPRRRLRGPPGAAARCSAGRSAHRSPDSRARTSCSPLPQGIGRLAVQEAERTAIADGRARQAAPAVRRERRAAQQADRGQLVAQAHHLEWLRVIGGTRRPDVAGRVAAIEQPAGQRVAAALAQQQVVGRRAAVRARGAGRRRRCGPS